MGPVYHASGAANRREQPEAAAPQSRGRAAGGSRVPGDRRRDAGDSTVFCYPQVMMTATKR